jgi:predicted membrane protein (TIGR00267 family)
MPSFLDPRYLILGLVEGTIVGLGLGARVIFSPEPAVANAVLNAGVITSTVNLITAFFAELHQERAHLLDLERKMVISQRGYYFHTALYHAAQLRVLKGAITNSASSFAGAAVLFLSVPFIRIQPLLGLLPPLILLFVLGLYFGHQVAGNRWIWGMGMVLAGAVVTVVGLFFPA